MTTTLPQPSRPSLTPPQSALPLIPTPKSRKNLPTRTQSPAMSKMAPPAQLSLKLRTPSSSPRPSTLPTPQHTSSSPNIPTLRSSSSALRSKESSPDKTLRRTISIASFPQPPKAGSRSSAGSGTVTPSGKKRESNASVSSGSLRSKRSTRTSNSAFNYTGSLTPSLLNGSGDGKSIPSGAGARHSEGGISIPSPAQSRSSSAQDSYSTSATTFEETDDAQPESKRSSRAKEGKGNVIVGVRVRPDSAGNDTVKADGEWMVDGRRSLVAYRGREGGNYYYDNVFAPHDNNAKVYDASAKRLVRRVMEGYHGTVFAYGMTGTGKTFSMQGTATNPGVIPLAITDIFSYIRETPHREFLLRVSYLEIYNEKIHDLLAVPVAAGVGGPPQQEEIKLREDSKRGVYASPLKEEIVQSPTQLLRVIARGDHARRTSSTQYNARSSRSHAVVQIVVESRERAPAAGSMAESKRAAIIPGGVRVSTLSLIDLAGSERAAESKERRTEGAHINKSLLTLGTVIARLSGDKDKNGNPTDKDGKHLPYRDSKLTRLLQPALSGNSLVSILCTIQIGAVGSAAAANNHTGETLNTLKFAARAKNNIVSHAKKAEEALGSGADAGSRVLLERYRMEIQTLRGQLDNQAKAQTEKEEKQLEKEAEQRHEEQMLEMQLARTALKERIEHLNRLILCSKSTGVNTGTMSALGMHAAGDGVRSIRSSASQSTLGASNAPYNRTTSVGSATGLTGTPKDESPKITFGDEAEEEDTMGEFGDGNASLQAQNRALQADLADKNRYISTLEKRLLQARRSSHSRMSMGFSPSHKPGPGLGITEDSDVTNVLQEKEMEIADLRARLDDKDRMVTALRSAARKRDMAELPPDASSSELKKAAGHQSKGSNTSSQGSGGLGPVSPVELLSPQKDREKDKKRRSVDEMSRILDEMIQDRVESGHLVKGSRGSVRLAGERKRESNAAPTIPSVSALVTSMRESISED